MTIELGIILAILSCGSGLLFGYLKWKRDYGKDIKKDTSDFTTVIVKLENISTGITRIETELCNVKNDVKEDRERIIRIEESNKNAHHRIDDACERIKELQK